MKQIPGLLNKNFLVYLVKFSLLFCFFYFGTVALIGITAPGGYYVPFIAEYLNYIDWLRSSLLFASKQLLRLLDYHPYINNKYELYAKYNVGIRMVYTCIGYGVMSFWAAFVMANKGSWKRKTVWILGGLFALWFINVLRITLLIVALDKKWPMPLGLDHHTWFNIVAYSLIFLMIYLYDRSSSSELKLKPNRTK